MVVLSNIRAYSDYDFFDGHQMQSGRRKGIHFYLMEMDCMLSTSGWLVCKVDMTKEFLSSRFSMKDMGEADVILVSTPMDTSEKLMPNNAQAISQLEYSRRIDCLMCAMTYTRPGVAFLVGKLSRYTSNPGTQHWQVIQRVLKYLKKTMDYSLTYTGYRSVLEGYINARLITAGKEAKWLRNLILEIPLWSKPIAPISILCGSAATLAKAYSQMYNGKSRHLGVRHSMIR
ncbi:hypothetical protein Tco_1289926 [Tanacetum coccineum]